MLTGAMGDYRLYYLTRNGHIVDAVNLWASDAAEAVEKAQALADGRAMELWLKSDRLKKWKGSEAPESD